MTFDEMFPDVPEFFEAPPPLRCEVIKCRTVEAPCWMCQKPTKWVEVNFEAHLCSPECVDQAWGEFFEAIERQPPLTSAVSDGDKWGIWMTTEPSNARTL
jgi:hypothetical protein